MRKMYGLFCLSAFMAANCGNSPLLNHKQAHASKRPAPETVHSVSSTPATASRNEASAPKKPTCELELNDLSPALCAQFTFDSNPSRDPKQFIIGDKGNPFTLRFWRRDSDRDAKVIPTAPHGTLPVVPMMLSMGHGSHLKTELAPRANDVGTFQGKLFLNMRHPVDKWTVIVQVCEGAVDDPLVPCKEKNVVDEVRFEFLAN